MPNIADITVKKADGTTDVVYKATTASGGDNSPAVWQNQTVGTTRAQYPTFALWAGNNGTKNARRLNSTYNWPKTKQDAGGNVTVSGGLELKTTGVLPLDMDPAQIKEACYQHANIMASALIKQCFDAGYSAT